MNYPKPQFYIQSGDQAHQPQLLKTQPHQPLHTLIPTQPSAPAPYYTVNSQAYYYNPSA